MGDLIQHVAEADYVPTGRLFSQGPGRSGLLCGGRVRLTYRGPDRGARRFQVVVDGAPAMMELGGRLARPGLALHILDLRDGQPLFDLVCSR